MAAETFQLRGRNYDDVVRQLISTYNSSQGWSLVRVVNRLTSLDVILERNSEQAKDTSKETSKATAKEVSKATHTEKVVDADATASDEQVKPSTGTTQPLETKEMAKDVSKDTTTEKPVAVKTTRKSQRGG